MKLNITKKQFLMDVILNLLATFVPIALLQLLILPITSKQLGGDGYGLMMTIIALLNTVPGTLGNSLNNVRLLNETKYQTQKIFGDFRLLFLICIGVSSVFTLLFLVYYESGHLMSLVLSMFLSLLWIAHEYYIVTFRIQLNYIQILINSLMLTIGYFIGFAMYMYLIHYWQLIYIIGTGFSLLHIMRFSDIWREKPLKTAQFSGTLRDTFYISTSGFLNRFTAYADKMLVFPLLGGGGVAVYYAASIFGKIISLGIGPMTSVILTYVSKLKKRPMNIVTQMLLIGGVLATAGYFAIVPISKILLQILYPEYLQDALPLVKYSALNVVLTVLISILHPFLLRFNKRKWQMIINLLSILVYVIISLVLVKDYGLLGFMIGLLVTSLFKLTIMLWVFFRRPEDEQIDTL